MIAIRNINIENFRNYKNINLDLKGTNGVYFISGDNGAGKTTLMNAINWCLYGDIVFHGVSENHAVRPQWANENDVTSVSIIIDYDDDRYVFRRITLGERASRLSTRKTDDLGNSEEIPETRANLIISTILPRAIKSLFFISENFSNEIFNKNGVNSLRNNIYKVSELDTITSAIRHLDAAASDFVTERNKIEKNDSASVNLQKEIDFYVKKQDENREDIKKAESKISLHQDEYDKMHAMLEKSAQGNQLNRELKQFDEDIKQIENDIFDNESEAKEEARKNFHKALLHDNIIDYIEQLREAEDQGIIPAPINPEVIQSIIDKGTCLCGHKIGPDELANIQALKENYEKINELKYLADGLYVFSTNTSDLIDSYYILKDLMQKKRNLEERLQGKQEARSKKAEEINQLGEFAQYDDPQAVIAGIKRDIEKWNIRKREYAQNILELRDEELKCRQKLKVILERNGDSDSKVLTKRLDKIQSLKEDLELLYANTENKIRQKIENGVWSSYSKILPNTQFSAVEITEDYDFRLKTKYSEHSSSANELSVGEAKTLALALFSTLSKNIGYSNTPLFIDNLYNGIDKSHYDDITKCVEEISKTKQIFTTYLYTDTDGSERLSNFFDPSVIQMEIYAHKNQENGKCELMEVEQ